MKQNGDTAVAMDLAPCSGHLARADEEKRGKSQVGEEVDPNGEVQLLLTGHKDGAQLEGPRSCPGMSGTDGGAVSHKVLKKVEGMGPRLKRKSWP